MNALRALVLHDIKAFLGNRRALIVNLLCPILLGAFMGYFFSDHGDNGSRITVMVVDEDQSALSRRLLEGMGKDKALEVRPVEAAKAMEAVRRGKASAALIVPAGFGDAAPRNLFQQGVRPVLTLLVDPSRTTEASLVRGLLAQHSMEAVSGEVFTGPSGLKMLKDSAADIDRNPSLDPSLRKHLHGLYDDLSGLNTSGAMKGREGQGMSVPYDLKEVEVTARIGAKYNGYAHSMAGMGVQFILFLGIDAGVGLLVMRRTSLWQRLRTAPVGRRTFLLARILGAAASAFLLLVGIFAAAVGIFGVRIQGSMFGLALVSAAFALFTGAYGLVIASLGRNPEATRGLSVMVTLFMVMLGGAWVPSFIFPRWLQQATLVIPTRWALDAMDGMTWRGLGLSSALVPAGLLFGCALVMSLVAVLRFPFEDK